MTGILDSSSDLMQGLASDSLIRLRQRYPDAYTLALLASLATRIEPSLLRALRITYSGHSLLSQHAKNAPLTVSSESRLWFSDIVASRSSNAIALLPQCAQILRQQLLKLLPELFAQVYDIIRFHHRELPRELLFVEELSYLSVLKGLDENKLDLPEKLRSIKIPDLKQEVNIAWLQHQLLSLPKEFLPDCIQVLKEPKVIAANPISEEPLKVAAAAAASLIIAKNLLEGRVEEGNPKPMFSSTRSWLRDCAIGNVHAAERLHDADALATDLFARASKSDFRFYKRFEPFLTLAPDPVNPQSMIYHHADSIEDKLDELIRGVRIADKKVTGEPQEDKPRSFKPTAMEAMYLCAAARLRAIGLLHGLFANERTARQSNSTDALLFDCTMPTMPPFEREDKTVDLDEVIKMLETFPSRSSRFINKDWNFHCRWTLQEKRILSSLIQSYSPNVQLESIPLTIGEIRVRELACLLRVATASLLVSGVCPLELRMQFKPGGIWEPRETNLATMEWIFDSYFDRGKNQLVIQAIVPPRFDIPDPRKQPRSLPVASIDYIHSVQFLGTIVQDVLDSVEPVLGEYTNTMIRSVEVQQSRFAPMEDEPDRDLPNNWLLPLALATDATEVAGTTALILRSFCKYGFAENSADKVSFRDEVEQVCRVVETMHPFNALALRLVHEIRTKFDWSEEPIKKQIKAFGERMEQEVFDRAYYGDMTADEAIRQGTLKNEDGTEVDIVVVTYYGRGVMSILIRSAFKGEVWLVEPAPDTHGRWVPSTSDRIEQTLSAENIRVRRVQAGNLFVLLSALQGKKSLAYLTGTNGMWAANAGGDIDRFVGSVGGWNALTTVKRFNGRAIVISEADKAFPAMTTGEEDAGTTVEKKMQAVLQEAEKKPWTQVEIVEKQLFDLVVTIGKLR